VQERERSTMWPLPPVRRHRRSRSSSIRLIPDISSVAHRHDDPATAWPALPPDAGAELDALSL